MKQRKRHSHTRTLFVSLALFLVVGQPFTALAAEADGPALDNGTGPETFQVRADPFPQEFLGRLERHTDHGWPKNGTTRAEYVQILYEAVGAPHVTVTPLFSDVPDLADYAAAVTWAHEKGVVALTHTDLFRPDDPITEEEAAEMLAQTLSLLSGYAQQMANSILAAYSGRNSDSDYALSPTALAAALDDLLSGRRTDDFPAIVSSGPPPQRSLWVDRAPVVIF